MQQIIIEAFVFTTIIYGAVLTILNLDSKSIWGYNSVLVHLSNSCENNNGLAPTGWQEEIKVIHTSTPTLESTVYWQHNKLRASNKAMLFLTTHVKLNLMQF